MAHLRIWADYYEREDIERLENLSSENEDFEVKYSDEWVTEDNSVIIDSIRISSIIDTKTIKKYDNEIQNAIDSYLHYWENYEEIIKSRTEKVQVSSGQAEK